MTALWSALYRRALRPALFATDPEAAHHAAMAVLEACCRWRFPLAILRGMAGETSGAARTVFGVRFPNAIGLAAGFDKDGVALAAWEALGFGFMEVGTLTAHPQPGNPRPRLFRLPEERALINRLGFNNGGAAAAAARFGRARAAGRWPSIPVGINLGKSKATPLEDAAADYAGSLEMLHPYGDYFALNVSSPNTPGLRNLQNRSELDDLLRIVQARNRQLATPRPLLVKIAPDLEWGQVEQIVELAHAHGLAGIIATNTTLGRAGVSGLPRAEEAGGLSGAPLRARATEVVRFLTSRTKLPVIAVGGVSDAASAQEKLDAGAVLVQLYTGFVYGGPTLVGGICRDMAEKAKAKAEGESREMPA